MLSTTAVRQVGTSGLMLDRVSSERTFQSVHGGDNFRLDDGAIAPLRKPELLYEAAGQPLHIHPFYLSNDAGGYVIAYADGQVDYMYNTGTVITIGDIGPTEYVQVCQIGDLMIVTDGETVPWTITEESLSGGGQLEPMANWPDGYAARFFATFSSFVVCGGITVSSRANGSMVKWSHPYSPGDGQLFWDATDPTLLSGENQLGTAGKDIEGLQPLRNFMMVYCDEQTYRMEYVGGAQVMSFPMAWDDDGAVGPHAFCARAGKALVVGYHDIYIHDGYQVQHIADGRISTALYAGMRLERSIKVVSYGEREEAWITYRGPSDDADVGINTRALIYNMGLNAFTRATIDTAAVVIGPRLGQKDTSFAQADINYGDTGGAAGPWSFDNTPLTFAEVTSPDDSRDMYYLTPKGLEVADVVGTGKTLPGFTLSWGPMTLGGAAAGDQMVLLQRIYPLVEGEPRGGASLAWRVGTAERMSQDLGFGAWQSYAVDTDLAVDVRASQRWLGLSVKDSGGVFFRLSGFDLELRGAGRQ